MEHHTRLGKQAWMTAQVHGEGTDVVLIHGIPGSAAVWEGVTSSLTAKYRVIVPDLVGFGASSRSDNIDDLWADRQANALAVVLDELQVSRAIVVGHDYGGPVAAHLLASGPDRLGGLILAAANIFGDTPIPFPLSGILWPLLGGIWERMLFSAPSLRMMVRQGVGTPGLRLDPTRYVGDRSQARAIRTIFASALRELAPRYAPITDIVRTMRVPMKVAWGDRDPFFLVEQGQRTAALVPGSKLITLAGAGHFLPEERPREIAELILEGFESASSS